MSEGDGTALAVEETLIFAIADLLDGVDNIAVGMASPLPGSAALLTRARSAGGTRVTMLGSVDHNRMTDGGPEIFNMCAQGRIGAFFLSGGQIDGQANVNLVGTGSYPKVDMRFSGSFGSSYVYFLVPRVILFRQEHTRRVFVDKVDFISAPGTSKPGVYRPGGPYALVTELCVMRFDRDRGRFTLTSVHPGRTVEEVRDNTGFDFDIPETVSETALPSAGDLALLRGAIAAEVAETYPGFARRVFGFAAVA